VAKFFNLLKDSDKLLWDGCINHSKLSVIAQMFIIKLDHRLSEADYDIIVEWTKNILPEGNRLKENFMLQIYDETPWLRILKN